MPAPSPRPSAVDQVDWITDPFALGFQQRALVAGLMAAGMAAIVGTWVVLRGLTFMGDALAHGVLPGVALGLLFGFNPVIGAIASALAMAAGINLIHRRAQLTEDTAIGLMFVGMLALGVVLISRGGSYSGSLTGILFGDLLATSGSDLALLGAGVGAAVAVTLVFYRPFLALCFSEQKAELLGMNPRVAHFAMLALVTMAVVTSFRTVGSLLIFGMMVAPPATAALLVRRVRAMMATALTVGAIAVLGGLLVSYHLGTAGSATISALSVFLFFVVLGVRGGR